MCGISQDFFFFFEYRTKADYKNPNDQTFLERTRLCRSARVRRWVICRFCKLRFVSKEKLLAAKLPMLPAEFKTFVKDRCREVHEELRKKFVALVYNADDDNDDKNS